MSIYILIPPLASRGWHGLAMVGGGQMLLTGHTPMQAK